MGGSPGWWSNSTFRWKAKWGTRVIRNKYTNRILAFTVDRMSPALRDHINQTGFVCEVDHRYYGLKIDGEEAGLAGDELKEAIGQAIKYGLNGICVAGALKRERIYECRPPDGPAQPVP